MLRLTKTRQFRVSNRMAVMAALLLVVTASAGLGNRFDAPENTSSATVAETVSKTPASETPSERVGSVAVNKRQFRVHLYLFRRN